MINKIRRMELEELTHQIIGASMEVHRTLGNGFQERIYQRCLAFELRDRKLAYESEFSMKILYKGHFVGMRRVDFFVEKKVMVELKAVIQLEDVYLAQAKNYLEAYNLNTGLLINFSSRSLQFKHLPRFGRGELQFALHP